MTNPIKILHVVFSLDPGGMENGVVNVANHLPPEEFQVDVCCLERRGAFADRLPKCSRVAVLNKQPGKSISTIWKLQRMIRKWQPDIIHSHNLGPLIYASWATLGGLLCPILQGEHGQFPKDELLPRRLSQRKKYYAYCKYIHTVSDSLRDQIVNLNMTNPEKVISIKNGVDTTRFRPNAQCESRRVLGIAPDMTVIGSAGRIVASKGYAELMESFESIEDPNCILLIVGEGAHLETLKSKREQFTCSQNIIFTGHMDKPETAYNAMDLFVLPSRVEGLSNVILEAMATELPCLVNDACGNSDMISDGVNGFQMNMDTTSELTTALKSVLDRKDRWNQLGKVARATVEDKFSITSMANNYSAVYKNTAKENR